MCIGFTHMNVKKLIKKVDMKLYAKYYVNSQTTISSDFIQKCNASLQVISETFHFSVERIKIN